LKKHGIQQVQRPQKREAFEAAPRSSAASPSAFWAGARRSASAPRAAPAVPRMRRSASLDRAPRRLARLTRPTPASSQQTPSILSSSALCASSITQAPPPLLAVAATLSLRVAPALGLCRRARAGR
jgi:hypothetical protein